MLDYLMLLSCSYLSFTDYILYRLFFMKKNVLLLEHRDNLRRIYESILSDEFIVLTARNKAEASGWLKRGKKPDFIVADNDQNVNSCTPDFLRFLKASGMYADIPVILLSPASSAIQQSGIWHISKPSSLLSQIKSISKEQSLDYPSASPNAVHGDHVLIEPVTA